MSRLVPNMLTTTAALYAAISTQDDLKKVVEQTKKLNEQQKKIEKQVNREMYKVGQAEQKKTLDFSSSPKHDALKSSSNISQPSSSVGRRR